jgi:hypothetical protein
MDVDEVSDDPTATNLPTRTAATQELPHSQSSSAPSHASLREGCLLDGPQTSDGQPNDIPIARATIGMVVDEVVKRLNEGGRAAPSISSSAARAVPRRNRKAAQLRKEIKSDRERNQNLVS